ncbi:MAG TPA: 4Fe-4S binding protein [Actinomycetota bacterium]|nr:4Fe-4S binding protein [Actinomycetota bacterium]
MVSKAVTVQYPDEIAPLPPRSRGVIALKEENCTVCMLCARECPDWCIYIEDHKERRAPKGEGKRAKSFNVLDRFAIDYALCMYCGICVEVCPYDALFWSPEFEYAEGDITHLTHEMDRLEDWMSTVLPPSPLEEGAKGPELKAAAPAPAAPPPAAEAPTAPPTAPPAARPAPVETAGAAPVETEPRPAGMSEAEYFEQRAAAGRLVRQKVFEEEIAKGSDPRVAEARAKAAEMRARKATVADAPPPVVPVADPSSGASVAESIAAAPTASGPAPVETEAAPPKAVAPEPAPAPAEPPAAPKPAAGMSDAEAAEVRRKVYEAEMAKGSDPRIAEARSKAAEIRARKGTKGPGG